MSRLPEYSIRFVNEPDRVAPPRRAKGPFQDDVTVTYVNEESSRTIAGTKEGVAMTGEIPNGVKEETGPDGRVRYVATEDLFRTRDGRIVGKKDPDKLTLLARSGQRIDMESARTVPFSPDRIDQSSKRSRRRGTGSTA